MWAQVRPMTTLTELITPRPTSLAQALVRGTESTLSKSLKTLLFASARPAPEAAPARERRATDRFQAEVICEDRAQGHATFRLTYDLSTFGVSTQYGPALPRGTRTQLWLHLPDDQPLPVEVTAEVVGENEHSGGMRLAFRSPSLDAARRLHRYLFGKPGRPAAEA